MLLTVKAELPVYGGYVIGRDGRVIFIKGAVPGELVEVSVDERKKDYSTATVRNVIEPSPFRRLPRCSIFGICGGCHLQFMEYEKQTAIKEEILADTLKRTGNVEIQLMSSLTDSEFGYRHRGQFKVSQDGNVGFYKEGTRKVVPVDECPVMVDEINSILKKLKNKLEGLREISIISGDAVNLLIKGNIPGNLAEELLETGISGIAFENGDSFGRDYITLDLNGLKYTVTPWSFFQGHWSLNKKAVELVANKLSPLEGKRILDLYAGAGNFSLPLAVNAKEVVAVEENPSGIEDGRRNAKLNGIKNCSFIRASLEENQKNKKNQEQFWESYYDIIIVDPPRPGIPSDCLKKILNAGSERLVYISCNPATLARDIKKMKEKYEIEAVHMVDFFPNTYHIEALTFMRLK